ncbi:MAG: hypothetical protein O7D86_00605 [Proteobacteria bacterium]|nr:hypothetical protein [Pseudomonadota bacterium]
MKIKITRSDFLLLLISIILTVLIALALIRWLAPTLLGIPGDLVLVQSNKEVPPYYENIFRKSE